MCDFDNLTADLSKSKSQSTLLLAIKAGKKAVNSDVDSSSTVVQHSDLLAEKETLSPKQGSNEWYRQRVGKKKLPTLIGLSGKNEFHKAWKCIRNKVPEEGKSFLNFKCGKIYESIAADTFKYSSGLKLSESPLILNPNDPEHYAASPDRILEVGSIFLRSYKSDELIELDGKYILEIKTRAVGSVRPLELINASHVCQCQLQMSCMPGVTATILLLYLPETKKFSMFLIKRDKPFTRMMMILCVVTLHASSCSTTNFQGSYHLLLLVLFLILILFFQCEDGPKTLQMRQSKLCCLLLFLKVCCSTLW